MAWIVGIGISLLLLFMFPRAVGAVLLLIALLAGGLFLWIKVDGDRAARRREAISVVVSHDTVKCSEKYPLFIVIYNSSKDTINSVRFDVEAHRSDFSSPLYRSGYHEYSSDRIIPGMEGWGSCWSLPRRVSGVSDELISKHPPGGLSWTATNVSPQFQAR